MPDTGLHWDLFCRVVDNWGDAGVCWRLAGELARRGHAVRLWIDDPAPLAWMAPAGAERVAVRRWPADGDPLPAPGDVVIEAFGCDPPPAFVAAMPARRPVWINLEYLSAEGWVERSHGLASPQASGPGAGLAKWFYFPGFSAATGGLLPPPPGADAGGAAAARGELCAELGIDPAGGERLVLLFCYPGAPIGALLRALAGRPTRLLAVDPLPPGVEPPAAVRVHRLPRRSQPAFDRLLRGCDLLFVRGEDSFVQAQRAGRPFVWQIYPQHDGVHAAKLDAFLDRHLADAGPALGAAIRLLYRRWNGLAPGEPAWPDADAWAAHARHWRDRLAAHDDLATQLERFVRAHREPPPQRGEG